MGPGFVTVAYYRLQTYPQTKESAVFPVPMICNGKGSYQSLPRTKEAGEGAR